MRKDLETQLSCTRRETVQSPLFGEITNTRKLVVHIPLWLVKTTLSNRCHPLCPPLMWSYFWEVKTLLNSKSLLNCKKKKSLKEMTAKYSYVGIRFWIQRMIEELQKGPDGGKGATFPWQPLSKTAGTTSLCCVFFVVQMYSMSCLHCYNKSHGVRRWFCG